MKNVEPVSAGRWVIKEEDPKPLTWEETLLELKQLETVRDYIHENWPHMEGMNVDDAVISVFEWYQGRLRRYEG